jgi:beta-glucosidase
LVSGAIGAAMVRGIQSTGVGSSLKHFAVNNQETDRMRVSANVSQRALREIYLPAFEHVIRQESPTTVMCAYNRVNKVHASQNRWLLTEILRDEWGYDGVVISDWGAVRDRVASVAAGLDLEMPPSGQDELVADAVSDGRLAEGRLDEVADRLRLLAARTADARKPSPAPDFALHHDVGRAAAAESIVLLKNDNAVLPLDPTCSSSIAVIGEFARSPRFQGGGSSHVTPTRVDSALESIRALVDQPDRVKFAPGYGLETSAPDLIPAAVELARSADVVLLFVGLPESAEYEGADRTTIGLPADQLALMGELRRNTSADIVVVLSNGGVVSTSEWGGHVPAIIEGWLLGQAGGLAIADVIFGIVNPSGHLTETIPLHLEDNPTFLEFPGADQNVEYGEGIYVGYRYYDAAQRDVAFGFGHGLSYTTFSYSDLTVEVHGDRSLRLQFTVTNTGTRRGKAVAQAYVRRPVPLGESAFRQLAAFDKLELQAGESQVAELLVAPRLTAIWSEERGLWEWLAGDAEVFIGSSLATAKLKSRVTLQSSVELTLDADSTVAEWLESPVGSPLLRRAISGGHYPWATQNVPHAAFIRAMPLGRLPAFTDTISAERVRSLSNEFAEAVARDSSAASVGR